MKQLLAIAGLFIALSLQNIFADDEFSQEYFAEGIDYELIIPAVPTGLPSNKVQVLEMFWYGCPHCYRFEPFIEAWKAEGLPNYVELQQTPAILNPNWALHARAYFAAEILDVVDKIHGPFFHALHEKNKRLNTVDEIATFFKSHGVSKKDFYAAYNSFSVATSLRKSLNLGRRFGLTGVPSIIINGKYRTAGLMAGDNKRMIEIIKFLAQKEHDETMKK